jgi:branched-chain amino acid transport system substrate-binding protein
MNPRRFLALTATSIVVVLAAMAAAGGTTVAQAPPPFKIGVVISLTGPYASFGTSGRNGVVLAARQINAKGGIGAKNGRGGRKIALTILDDNTNPNNAINHVNRLIADGADAIVGLNGGLTQVPASTALIRRNVLTLAASGFNVGQQHGAAYFFMPPSVPTHAKALQCYVTKRNAARVGIIADSAAGSQSLKGELEKLLGNRLVANETVPSTATDVTVQVSKVRDANPSLILNIATGQSAPLVQRTINNLGIRVPSVGWLAAANTALLKPYGSSLNGWILEGLLAPADPTKAQEVFVRTYQRNYGLPADAFAAWQYDAIKLIAAAAAKVPNAKQADGVKLGRALESMTVPGVVGTYKFGKFNANDPEAHTGIHAKDINWLRVEDADFKRGTFQPKC